MKQFCLSFEDQTVIIDLFFNIFFLFYFGLRVREHCCQRGRKRTTNMQVNGMVSEKISNLVRWVGRNAKYCSHGNVLCIWPIPLCTRAIPGSDSST